MLTRVHTIICEVQDMDASVQFYRDILGLQNEYSSPHWSSFRLGESRLGLHPPFQGGSAEAKGGGWVLGVETDDISRLNLLLTEKGVATGAYHDTPGGVVMDFQDPDGNRLQAIQPGMTAAKLSA
jgi:catechol 2,3-dioxygenase-like lactoylglutathione lyase family enzyme